MTFTAVARCPRTGMLGVAMATRAVAVGSRCPVVVPGYGAASVQLIADPRKAQLCGRLLALGYSAPKVLAELRASDPHIGRRQIGIVDSYGNAAAFSGETKGGYSGHVLGRQFVAMGNAVVSAGVVEAIAASLEAGPGASEGADLCDRLIAAVEAGAQAGGQAEGQRSAAILVFDTEPFAHLDLRVDLHDDPVAELRRIYDRLKPLIPYFRQRPY
ncbi:MAG TPA: DUF1028 domain-containing protein, partial [Acetobacteraceae bacterium]|nr:DUF1028 domain-containing protein [Acetobacteraceae bacterium]